MSVIYIVLPLALVFVVVAVGVFLRLVHSGQLDDLETPPVRMLHDDDPAGSRPKGRRPPAGSPRRRGRSG